MSDFKRMTCEQLAALKNTKTPHVLIDVRTDQEIAICQIPDSRHIVMDQIPMHCGELDKNEKIIVYCKAGGRSAHVAQFLVDQGFQDVTNLEGGILDWIQKINPEMTSY